jgi:TM2 domain-containing membrane protein YozV
MSQYVTNTSDKSKKTATIMCCLGFAGLGGLHYFYVGRYGKGLLYFFTGGLFFVGTVLDLISICSGSFRDNAGAPLRE